MALPTPQATTPYGLNLTDASFRGALFAVAENSGSGGRRGQTHEYPFRDTPYDEDLGRRARRIAFKAFVIGDDAPAQRDQLISALEQKGPGLLSHPNMGERMMAVDKTRPFTFIEIWDKLRRIEFDLAFVEPGQDLYPTSSADTQAASNTAANGIGPAGDQAMTNGTSGGIDTQATQIAASDGSFNTVRSGTGATEIPSGDPLISSAASDLAVAPADAYVTF